jgi:hypothetical protein
VRRDGSKGYYYGSTIVGWETHKVFEPTEECQAL